MKSAYLKLPVLLIASFIISGLACGQNNQEEASLKKMVESEFILFQDVLQTHGIRLDKIIYSNDPNVSTHVTNGDPNLVIKLNEIAPYVKDSNSLFKSTFIRFVMAHELGHKMQFLGYKKEVVNNAKGENLLSVECEADVIGGFLITEVQAREVVDLQKKSLAEQQAYAARLYKSMLSVYYAIFNMSNVNESRRTHPTNAERLIAIRQGVTCGSCFWNYFNFANNTPASLHLSAEDFNLGKQTYLNLAAAIGYFPAQNDNPFIWAHLEALRILHNNNALARNVVMYNKKDNNWHKTTDNPTVDYSFSVVNENKVAVEFSGRVFTEMVPRKDQYNMVVRVPFQAKIFDVILQPGESKTIAGTLKWYATEDFMPAIILPDDETSLYNVYDPNNLTADNTETPAFDNNFDNWTPRTLSNIDNLLQFLVPKRNSLFNYAKGIGISDEATVEDALGVRRFYEPTFKKGSEYDQQIFFIEKSGTVGYSFDVFDSQDEATAKKHYDEIVAKTSASFPQYTSKEHTSSIFQTTEYKDAELDRVIKVTLRRDAKESDYSIKIEVYGTKSS